MAWPAAAGHDPDPFDMLALESLRESWSAFYDIGYAGGAYWMLRLTGGSPMTADTPDGLESVIRADYTRWTTS